MDFDKDEKGVVPDMKWVLQNMKWVLKGKYSSKHEVSSQDLREGLKKACSKNAVGSQEDENIKWVLVPSQ